MIDFKNAEYLKLKPVDPANFTQMLSPMFVDGEEVLGVFQSVRDGIMFTNKRIFAVNVQGISGRKRISRRFLTVRFRLFLSKRPVCTTLTVNSSSGSADRKGQVRICRARRCRRICKNTADSF
jgi:hypothetical protein